MKLKVLGALALSGVVVLSGLVPATAVAPDDWSTPADLSVTASEASAPQVAVAPDNTVVAAWIRTDGTNEIIQSSASTDRGVTWSVPVNLSAAGEDASGPQLAVAPNNTFTAIWDRFDGSNNIVQTSSSADGGATWSTPVDISVAGQPAQMAQISAASDNSLTAVWRRSNGSRTVIQSSSSLDGGATWSTPVDLSDATRNATTPQIAIAGDGTRTVVWQRTTGGDQFIRSSSSTDGGTTWSVPVDLSAAGQDSDTPQVFAAPDNSLTAVWERSDGSNIIVQASSSSDGGVTWSSPVDLSAAGGDAEQVQLTITPGGLRTAFWQRDNGSNRIIQSSSSADNGATWSAPLDVSALGGDARQPQVSAAPDNTLVAVWNRNNGSDRVLQASYSVDQGATWSAAADISAAGGNVARPQIAVAADSNFVIVWDFDTGTDETIQSSIGLAAPEITSAVPDEPALEEAYSFQLTATGMTAPTFTVSAGVLPTGLSLSADGLLSGTPTAPGEFTFTVTASNGTLPDTTATYTLTTLALLPATGQSLPWPLIIGGGVALLLGAGLLLISRLRNSAK